ncbi:MAG: SusE domain-containing protein [Bacteroidales bacterium]|nr:SusE domain-containing protein [Bacteroidales bacterium]MCF8387444.1 SusE domain-containing protein [Bacteroidales bacterium]MCF8396748.1 SusE domain-containing protein [Bacteroidales bacterium]
MKKINSLLILMIGIGLLLSCEKKDEEPVLNMSQTEAPAITAPAAGEAFVLEKDNADSLMATFKWNAAKYSLDELEDVTYQLQMDFADSNFKNLKDLAATQETEYTIKVGAMNANLLTMGAPTGVASDMAFRLLAFVNNETDYTNIYSGVTTLSVTPYEDVTEEKLIYLLGSGTTVGWDNAAALPMTPLGDGTYAIVEHLTPASDAYIKFISVLGFWAPQWGTDATGTWDAGPLVYRPTEDEPDPDAIPVGDTEGNYYILADTVGLTYETMLTSGELYLVGDATPAGWDNTAGIPFEQDAENLTKFSLTVSLNAEGGMKFLEVSGEWAPQWGSYDGTVSGGTLAYRPTETAEDPPEIPAPGTSGEYLIEVDLTAMKYTLTPQ